jgi:hypothetical protein
MKKEEDEDHDARERRDREEESGEEVADHRDAVAAAAGADSSGVPHQDSGPGENP